MPLQFLLVAGQFLELPLALFGAHAGQLTLAAVDLFLSACKIADPVERRLIGLVLLLLFAGLDLRTLLVIGALLTLQFLVEQCRKVLRLPVAAAAAGVGLLLHHLPAPHFGLRLHEMVQRGHLVRDRVSRPGRRQLFNGAGHGLEGVRDRITARRPLWRRLLHDVLRHAPTTAASTSGTEGTFHPRLQLGLRLGNRLDVLLRPAGVRTALDVPCRADDLLLCGDEALELGITGGTTGASLTLRLFVLGVEGMYLEKEHIGLRDRRSFAATHIPSACVIRDDVPRSDLQVFGRQQVMPGLLQRVPFHLRERDDVLLASGHRKDEVERGDTIVILRARLDGDLFERCDPLICRRSQDPDIGGPVVHQPDEVLAVPLGAHAVAIRQGDAIRIVLGEH